MEDLIVTIISILSGVVLLGFIIALGISNMKDSKRMDNWKPKNHV